jgi:hypothetical protein
VHNSAVVVYTFAKWIAALAVGANRTSTRVRDITGIENSRHEFLHVTNRAHMIGAVPNDITTFFISANCPITRRIPQILFLGESQGTDVRIASSYRVAALSVSASYTFASIVVRI